MASNRVYEGIDENYPQAGKDNDSQGFRDNFGLVKTGLQTAQSEISSLQTTRARLDQANDFGGNNITNANTLKGTSTMYNGGVLQINTNISFESGHYQNFTIAPSSGSNITLTLTDWPASGRYALIRVSLFGRDQADTVTWETEGAGTFLKVPTGFPNTPTIDTSAHPYIFEFWTYDGGTTVFGEYKGHFNNVI